MFKWFLDMPIDQPALDATTFTKNRTRLGATRRRGRVLRRRRGPGEAAPIFDVWARAASYGSGVSDAAPNDSTHWRDVDESADPETFVDYLDRAAAVLQESRRETMRMLAVAPGCAILDVGCGAGEFLIELATSVTNVRCVGVDASRSMIETASARGATAGTSVTFAVGDAKRLDFPDASFDRVNCSRVLMHVEQPLIALQEMARVLAPDGRLVVFEPDFDALMIDSDDMLAGRAVRTCFTGRIENPDIGRRLRRLVVAAGLDVVDVTASVTAVPSLQVADGLFHLPEHLHHAVTEGALGADQAREWRSSLRTTDARGLFNVSVVGFRVLAMKRDPAPDATLERT